jgi:hypothetical protein
MSNKQTNNKHKSAGKRPVVVKKEEPAVVMPPFPRGKIPTVGLEQNSHTVYDSEVKFENIQAKVNIVRVKDDDSYEVGVAKGALLEPVSYCVPKNDAGATMQAMKKRCDYKPSLESMEAFMRGHDAVMAKFPQLEEIRVDQDLLEEYLDQCKPSKAARLREAMLSGEYSFSGDRKHVFAKQEVLLKEHRAQPRIVYQGEDMYNLLTGCVVMQLNHRMKLVFSLQNPGNTGNKLIYACGSSGEELGDIIEGAKGQAIESDAKNNDGSQSAEFREYEAMLYRKLGAPMWFVEEFILNVSVDVWTRYGVMARIVGGRWSGESTTTTGNSYVHMVLILSALLEAEITESTNVHGGDDYLGFVEKPTEFKKAIEKVYQSSGMVAEVVLQPIKHRATFYRKRYVKSSIGTRPVPQFGRAIAKLNLRANRNAQIGDREYMAGKYLSAAYEHRYVPMVKEILLSTSERLSRNPHIDEKDTKILGMGVTALREKMQDHPTISEGEFSDFLDEVYQVNIEQLVDVYTRVASSALDYADGWTSVDYKTGKSKNKANSSRYQVPYLDGAVVDALVARDVS